MSVNRHTNGPDTKTRQRLGIEDGLIELRSQDAAPRWIWASTCPRQRCQCRSALVLALRGDQEALVRAARTVETIRGDGKGPGDLEAALGEDCAAFEVDIDTGEFRRLDWDAGSTSAPEDDRAELEQRYPWLGAVLGAIDGEVLEQLGRLWYRGKRRPNPESSPQSPASVAGWTPDEVVS